MTLPDLPTILDPEALEPLLGAEGLLVVDLCKPDVYARLHVPGAVFLDYGRIVAARSPVAGLMPDPAALEAVLSGIGIGDDTHVIAYDDEGGGKAGRLLWTLDVLGHRRSSLLNGGLHAWANEGRPLEARPAVARPAQFTARPDPAPSADADYVLDRLADPELCLLDARSAEEYSGAKRLAARGGHIPGAVHWDWLEALDRDRNLRLRPEVELRAELEGRGVTADRIVVTYCQTHHRSSLSYMVLKSLGYPRIKGYPGSWSDWGNRPDTPVE
ncbi:MAG: sulfurtransferase [Chromatiales bacterium]|jgi:thiosulfate/3-mercaptopyruvate sulfurtransferase